MREGFQQVAVNADQGVIHLFSAEDLPMLVVILNGKAQDLAGLFSLPAFTQQRMESRQVVDISPLGQEQVRIQEGNENHHNGHQAEGVHNHDVRQQEAGDNPGFQNDLDGQQADDFMGAQFLQMPEDADGGKGQVAAVAGKDGPVQRALVKAVFNPEQPVGPGGCKGNQYAGNIYNRSKHAQAGPQQCFRVQNTDREHKEHIGTYIDKDKKTNVNYPEQLGGMLRPCLIQTEGSHLKNFRADIDDQNGKESTVEADRQFGTEKVVAHDDHKDQHAWNGKAVVHLFGYWPFPWGDLSARIVKNEITGGCVILCVCDAEHLI